MGSAITMPANNNVRTQPSSLSSRAGRARIAFNCVCNSSRFSTVFPTLSVTPLSFTAGSLSTASTVAFHMVSIAVFRLTAFSRASSSLFDKAFLAVATVCRAVAPFRFANSTLRRACSTVSDLRLASAVPTTG
jgi:hypothetical protein